MGIGIFDRLGFPDSLSANTINFSPDTQNSLNNMPPILVTWQMEDIANDDTSGYFQNPVYYSSNYVKDMLIDIETYSQSKGYTTIYAAANSAVMANTATNFIDHTNRLSGVTPMTADTVNLPHYQNCIGIGKALTYIVYQSDGISNNAVLTGNFGSLFTLNTISYYADTLLADKIKIVTSPSLSGSEILQIISDINGANNFMANNITQDVNYFANCNSVLASYNAVKGLSTMGDTEKYLVNNLIGTTKLKSRIS